jgi:hypothetical protein
MREVLERWEVCRMTEIDPRAGQVLAYDFDDVELELYCSAREATVGLIPASDENSMTRPTLAANFRPWKSG